ncbi:hypothetical protein D3C85_1871400 [compost metagenome]
MVISAPYRINQLRQTPLTLQQRLSQLIGAKLTTLINPFGLVEEKKKFLEFYDQRSQSQVD